MTNESPQPHLRKPLRLGTRASGLARWQANWVAQRLREKGVEVEIVPISTQGDVKTEPLGAIGGQGLFTKEIQRALLDNEVDLAVHSLKDLPTDPVAGLTLAAIPPRESPHDALVCGRPFPGRPLAGTGAQGAGGTLQELPLGSRLGTGSPRRRAQLWYARPDLKIEDIRGNVDTRLRKLDEGQYDALILAEAGLRRMGWESRISQTLPAVVMLPAVGQGALGLETRADDAPVCQAVAQLDDQATRAAVEAERALLRTLRAGCLAPVGAWGQVLSDGRLRLEAAVLSLDGNQRLFVRREGSQEQAACLGEQVARQLVKQGAAELIANSKP